MYEKWSFKNINNWVFAQKAITLASLRIANQGIHWQFILSAQNRYLEILDFNKIALLTWVHVTRGKIQTLVSMGWGFDRDSPSLPHIQPQSVQFPGGNSEEHFCRFYCETDI